MTRELPVPLLDADAVAEAAAEVFVAAANAAVERSGRFVAALAGGSTPSATYARLATDAFASRIPWESVWIAFGDERNVPPDHEASNVGMAHETLLDKVPIPPEQILGPVGGGPQPARAAWFYEEALKELFPGVAFPRFDLVFLGLGEDGHTASLFPGTGALSEHEKWVTANWLAATEEWRITLTYPTINHASLILFLVIGRSKAPIVAEVFGRAPHDGLYPAERVDPVDGTVEVFLDREAAAELDRVDPRPKSPPDEFPGRAAAESPR
ncbi:MAG: 6-phosphogluconolactonase [Planctomycetota bacterium]|nr:6-phosphogluconolactonase [Planctomycetota bacterium]